jgi:hypothetical protein
LQVRTLHKYTARSFFRTGAKVFSRSFGVLSAALLTGLCGCGSDTESLTLTPGEQELLQSTAGILARHWCLPEQDPGWREPPGEEEIARITGLCSSREGAWTYFYRCMSDTANTLQPPPFPLEE